MDRRYFLILLLIVGHRCFAQTQQLLVLDSLNNTPISNVLLKTNAGDFYTNVNGVVLFGDIFVDSMIVSHPQYYLKTKTYGKSCDTVFLSSKPHLLDEFTLKANPLKKVFDIGYHGVRNKNKKSIMFNDYNIIAVFVPNSSQHVYIDKILLSLKARKYSESYNVYLYEQDSMGMPGKTIYKQTIVVDSLVQEGEIDIQSLKIQLPESGVFIGLENLKIYDFENERAILGIGVRFDYTEEFDSKKTVIFIKDEIMNPKRIWFDDYSPFSKSFTPCFGLQVY